MDVKAFFFGGGGQGRCERRSEVFVKIKRKKLGGGWGSVGQGYVSEEFKFL